MSGNAKGFTEGTLPKLIPLARIEHFLPRIFPEGTAHRNYVIRQMAAKTIFTMLYTGAVEGYAGWFRPAQVTLMSDGQAARRTPSARRAWATDSLVNGRLRNVKNPWYATNSREPIRDETLRNGLVLLGAVIERGGVPTTSGKPRYALEGSFAQLLADLHAGRAGDRDIQHWQKEHLSHEALARISLLKSGAAAGSQGTKVAIAFPNGETRLLPAGPSAVLTKAVIERFTKHFLAEPAVLFVSDSGEKVVARDDRLARSVGLQIEAARNLPDIILVDVALKAGKLVFIEVVATDGAITQARRKALASLAAAAKFLPESVYYVTAFTDRAHPAFRKLVSELAWNSLAWFASEPDRLIRFQENAQLALACLPASSE